MAPATDAKILMAEEELDGELFAEDDAGCCVDRDSGLSCSLMALADFAAAAAAAAGEVSTNGVVVRIIAGAALDT